VFLSDNSLMMIEIKFPTDLETVALLQFTESADGVLRAQSPPNWAFEIEVVGDEVRFIPADGLNVERFRLVRV
jgi:hypothetical protein